jgi:hypothetical protein
MTGSQVGDVLQITTHDGNTLVLIRDDVKLLAYGNFGAPNTQFITRRGYLQDGETEVAYTLQSRAISVELWHSPACSRQDYWDVRKELHDFLRPNRGGPLTFTLQTPNGNQRSIIVRADPGLTFPSQNNNNNWNVQESLDFHAFDPLFFDSAQVVTSLTSTTQLQLVFPITFPITFGTSDVFLTTGVITYSGTWKSYPIITITGPYTRANIQHVGLGINIALSVAIVAGESRIIDLTPGAQSITDGNGVNKFSDLGAGSDLVDFALLPDPEVTGGIQTITVQLVDGVAGVSTATIAYYNRYFAL